MHKPRDTHPFEDNPFVEGWLDWMASPQGQRSVEVADALWELMADVQLDPWQRELIWPEGGARSLDQTTEHIQQQYPRFPRQRIERFLISWLENYAPESYSEEKLEELDRLIEPWLDELERRSKSG